MVIPSESGPGFTYTWTEDNRVLVITTTSVARESVDAFVIFMSDILIRWPTDKPFLCMQEFTPDLSVTPYLLGQGENILRINRSDMTGKFAVVTPNMAAFTIFDLWLQSLGNMFPNIEWRTFTDNSGALVWLLDNENDYPH